MPGEPWIPATALEWPGAGKDRFYRECDFHSSERIGQPRTRSDAQPVSRRHRLDHPHGPSLENCPTPCLLSGLGSTAKRGPLCAGVGVGGRLAWLRPRPTLRGGAGVLECRSRCGHTCSCTEPSPSAQPPPCPHSEHKESKLFLHVGFRLTSPRVDTFRLLHLTLGVVTSCAAAGKCSLQSEGGGRVGKGLKRPQKTEKEPRSSPQHPPAPAVCHRPSF